MTVAAARSHDDYVAFCRGLRELCGIDLLDYKRGQMERRVRSFADRRGQAALPAYLETLATTTILGTDVDRGAIDRAQRGEFTAEDVRHAPPGALKRFFPRDGELWRPSAELRALVAFEVGDLLRLRPASGAYDLVLCRNTVIYFNTDVRDALHARLAHALRPGGVLVVGATERIAAAHTIGLDLVAPFTYRKA
jgi:chemotaxis protein methyltransferase CheR